MDTIRVDINYRPLRIAWAIAKDDKEAFREAVRLSHCLWGGRFNPIVIADDPNQSGNIIECFRPDMIFPIGSGTSLTSLNERFPYLFRPFYADGLHFPDARHGKSQVLDIHNAAVHLHASPEWRAMKDRGVRNYTWADTDPLADVFLCQLA